MNLLSYFKSYMVDATLYRTAAGSYDAAGRWVPGVETETPIRVLTPQPAPGEFLKNLPEGVDRSAFLMTAVDASIAVQTAREGVDADEIEIGGARFEAVQIGRWDGYAGFGSLIIKKKDA
jgi:hypothetical protein